MDRRALYAALLAVALASGPAIAQVPGVRLPADVAARIVAGKTTRQEVEKLLGRPAQKLFLRAEQREAWGYPYAGTYERRIFWVEWSADGTAHSTNDTVDYEAGRFRGS